MLPNLNHKLVRFAELEEMMGEPAVISNPTRLNTIAKEHGTLTKLVNPYREWLALTEQVKNTEQLLTTESDPEMLALLKEEIASLNPRLAKLQERIEDMLLVDPSEDFGSVIMEIRAGTGGDEAAIFAGNLYDMYTRYARTMGWQVEGISFSAGEHGGFKEVSFSISGDDVYRYLRFESGGHRVQRVPKTETQGRIHTSAATVAILPEPDEVQVEIKPDDLEVETMRAGGAGGQHVNKTESAVRLWYKRGTPDEIEVKCQDERSQGKNRASAMRVLRSRIFERQQEKLHQARAEVRRNLIGSGDRSERIRTYNFPQNRVTDHRINLNLYQLDMIMMGEISDLINPILQYDKQQRLEEAMAG
jgi:peptide chain release factor 1